MDKRITLFPGSSRRFPVVPANKTTELVEVLGGPPWGLYKRSWTIGTTKRVTVAYKDNRCDILFTVKERGKISEQQIFAAQQGQLKHRNLAPIIEIFTSDAALFLVSPYYSATLETINSCPQFPSAEQLAVITREIIQGLTFLEAHGWIHTSIRCSNVLLSARGDVVLSNIEDCYPKPTRLSISPQQALGRILATTMEKSLESRQDVSVQHPESWPTDTINFLGRTGSATLEELRKHPFIHGCQSPSTILVPLVEFAKGSALNVFEAIPGN